MHCLQQIKENTQKYKSMKFTKPIGVYYVLDNSNKVSVSDTIDIATRKKERYLINIKNNKFPKILNCEKIIGKNISIELNDIEIISKEHEKDVVSWVEKYIKLKVYNLKLLDLYSNKKWSGYTELEELKAKQIELDNKSNELRGELIDKEKEILDFKIKSGFYIDYELNRIDIETKLEGLQLKLLSTIKNKPDGKDQVLDKNSSLTLFKNKKGVTYNYGSGRYFINTVFNLEKNIDFPARISTNYSYDNNGEFNVSKEYFVYNYDHLDLLEKWLQKITKQMIDINNIKNKLNEYS